jgi:hypothetical protein
LIRNDNEKKTIVIFKKTAMRLRSQRPLYVQGDAGHPSYQSGGQEKNIQKKWRADEEERHKGLLTQKGLWFRNQSCWIKISEAHSSIYLGVYVDYVG